MMTIEDFMSRLNNGEYAAQTNARRALGRASFSARDKKRAQQAIDAFFRNAAADAPSMAPAPSEDPLPALRSAVSEQLGIADAVHKTVETCDLASQKMGLDVRATGELGISVLRLSLRRLEKILSQGLVAEATAGVEPASGD